MALRVQRMFSMVPHGGRYATHRLNRDLVYISDPVELASFCERAQSHKVLAVDTEFIRERTYYPQLCLIQVGTGEECVCIDPLLIDDLAPLADLLTDGGIVKVFHACTQDLEAIHTTLGIDCAPVFDTQVAAAFLGLRQQIGYGALVESYCKIHLPKAESLADWSRRPLDADELQYAEDDVRYLPQIHERMLSDLTRRGRLSWVEPEMALVTDASRYVRDPREAYTHLKRANSLTRKQLAVARELCSWREELAAQRDIPRKWVVSDEVIVEACKRLPHSPERLRRIRGAEQLKGTDVRGALAAIDRGTKAHPETYPKKSHHERPSQEVEGVLDLMYAMLRVVSNKSGIAPQLIATKDDLLDFMQGRAEARIRTSGWRYDLVGRQLERLLAGEMGLTVKEGHVELL